MASLIYGISNSPTPRGGERRIMVAKGCWETKEMLVKEFKVSLMRESRFWRSNVEYSGCSQQYCIVYLKYAKRVGINCSYHTQKM